MKTLLNRILGLAATTAALGVMALPAQAITVSVNSTAGTSFNTNGLDETNTDGPAMAGMEITAQFFGGGSETVVWVDDLDGTGSATGSGWSLSFSGTTTFNSPWTLSSTDAEIISLIIDGVPGDTVFDILEEFEVSPDSARGNDLLDVAGTGNPPTGPGDLIMDGTYSNQVLVQNILYGDLYSQLTLDFSRNGRVGGLGPGETVTFVSDTDNTVLEGDLTQVPEPGTIALLGLGLLAFGLQQRRRAR